MATQFKRFTDEQIERANRVDIVDYARSQGLELKRTGKSYRVANYSGGFYITPEKNSWNWFNEERGGGVVQLCMELENKTWIEAVRTLLNEDMEPIRHTKDWKPEPEPPKEFKLPPQNDNYRHVFAYLTKTRGIDASIVKEMVDKKLIYENTQKSCVFVGRDKDGVAKHASVRSTNTYGKVFKQDVTGSQKAFSFSISGNSGTLNVFEAPIDALSYMSIQKLYGRETNDSYLSLGGVTDKALERFLADNKDIEKIRVCTDQDVAGEGAVTRIYEKYGKDYKVTRHRPVHKDFNEDLIALRQQERNKEQRQSKDNEKEQPKVQAVDKDVSETKTEPEAPKTQETKPVLNKEILKQAGISQSLIDWYESEPNVLKLDGDTMQIEASSDWLIVCDNPVEAFAIMHKDEKENPSAHSDDGYKLKEHFLTYKNMNQVASYLKAHPNICIIGVATSRTETGELTFSKIKEQFETHDIAVGRMSPKLLTHVQDVNAMNAMSASLEQTPLEEIQSEVAVAMEM